ncbi:YcxB family protein [Virgibacillus pantothenticus]|uniref:YcxB-like C-terminal domain-containing protein n=1 Tax=Virgibacillus pantothenticus TaxID=1473 RepID=A0A0L0QLD9_VIRPA|nr:YcxB family protein [Virgibacillus pantothenticus]KNE19381.1 hypothetical protein AFK71_12820 [Virgibacillus pantothenticus]MED3738799.1 YcxB family protein [Virgibacillus pantothenticus]QTY15106.1 YcxB family protein [Virgibacillus pantothenticus]SIT14209.1 YcxB-like protein [Virgibacillus pantothenticus]
MIAKFNITDKDLIAQQKNAIKTTKFHRITRIMQLIVFFLFVVYILAFSRLSTDNYMFGLILCLILTPVVWKSYEYATISRSKGILKHHKNKLGGFTLNLSDEGFTKESKNLTEKVRWDELKQLKEDEKRYFLYLTDLHAITIKKEPENMNIEEVKAYQEFIKRKVNK